LSHDDNDFITR